MRRAAKMRLALAGASGSGKTTLSLILSGFLQPVGGTVRFDGEPADFSRLHRMAGGKLYIAGDLESDVAGGGFEPFSPRVGIVAAMQANTVIALLLGEEP